MTEVGAPAQGGHSRARGAASLVVGGIVALDVVRFVVVVGSAGSPPGAHGRPPDVPAAVARRLRAPLVHGGVPAGDIDVLRHAGHRRLPTALRRLGVTNRHPPQRLSVKRSLPGAADTRVTISSDRGTFTRAGGLAGPCMLSGARARAREIRAAVMSLTASAPCLSRTSRWTTHRTSPAQTHRTVGAIGGTPRRPRVPSAPSAAHLPAGGARGFHAVNVLLHGLATWLLWCHARATLRRRSSAFAAALLFALHPLNSEAVA